METNRWQMTKPTRPGLYWAFALLAYSRKKGVVAVEVYPYMDQRDLIAKYPGDDLFYPISHKIWQSVQWIGPIVYPAPPEESA